MRNIEDIKYICADRFDTSNHIIARGIFKQFSNDRCPDIMSIYKLVNLKENEIYGSSRQEEFFNKMKKNNYNSNFEIIYLLDRLFTKPKVNTEEVIDKYKNSPYISSIEFSNKSLKVETETGNYNVDSIHNYLKRLNFNPAFLNKLLVSYCHKNAAIFLNYHPSLYGITSFCKTMFNEGSHYHSYCYDNIRNKVIDPSYKIVMDKEEYDKLFGTEEIYKIRGYNLENAFDTARRHNLELGFYYQGIAVTLFQQYIWENELPTPNGKLYSEKPKNKHLLIKNR